MQDRYSIQDLLILIVSCCSTGRSRKRVLDRACFTALVRQHELLKVIPAKYIHEDLESMCHGASAAVS